MMACMAQARRVMTKPKKLSIAHIAKSNGFGADEVCVPMWRKKTPRSVEGARTGGSHGVAPVSLRVFRDLLVELFRKS